jgi:hypothetical protein
LYFHRFLIRKASGRLKIRYQHEHISFRVELKIQLNYFHHKQLTHIENNKFVNKYKQQNILSPRFPFSSITLQQQQQPCFLVPSKFGYPRDETDTGLKNRDKTKVKKKGEKEGQ